MRSWKEEDLLTTRLFALPVEPHEPEWLRSVDLGTIFHSPVLVCRAVTWLAWRC
jgi:hypothetical protein